MQYPFDLSGKQICITGASSGIGRASAIHFAQQGACVAFTGRNLTKLEDTKAAIPQDKGQYFVADLNSDEELKKLVEALPVLDGLLLNAGVQKTLPAKFIKRPQIDELFNVNIQSAIVLVQLLLKKKKINRGASICFISSIASKKATVGNALYAATKGAVNSFTRALALELASKQIRVNAVLPGFVQTDILKEGVISQEQLDTHRSNYPIGRFGEPNDVAYLLQYLLSDASQWMTGSLLTIDGGFSLK